MAVNCQYLSYRFIKIKYIPALFTGYSGTECYPPLETGIDSAFTGFLPITNAPTSANVDRMMFPKVFNWMRPMSWKFSLAKHARKHRLDPNTPINTLVTG